MNLRETSQSFADQVAADQREEVAISHRMLRVWIAVLVLIAAWALVNRYDRGPEVVEPGLFPLGSATQLQHPTGKHPEGLTVKVQIPGPSSGVGERPAYLWLPPQYFTASTGTRFPVIYLYRGTPSDALLWFTGGHAARAGEAMAAAGRPAILVAPTGAATEDMDTECVNGKYGNWSDYLTVDVPRWITDHTYGLTGPDTQAVAGFSMGGYCAQILALRNPTQFGVVGNFSGTSMPTHEPSVAALFSPGQDLKATIDTYRSEWLIRHQPAARVVKIWDIIGDEDDQWRIDNQRQFISAAQALGMTARFSTLPGTHSFEFWAAALAEWLPWALDQLRPAGPTPPASP